jgi:hypothetical protein
MRKRFIAPGTIQEVTANGHYKKALFYILFGMLVLIMAVAAAFWGLLYFIINFHSLVMGMMRALDDEKCN